MNKEYQALRFFSMVFLLLIVNSILLLVKGGTYYIWFCVSIAIMLSFFIKERKKHVGLLKKPSSIRVNKNIRFILVFLFTYPSHYQIYYKHVESTYVAILQIINIALFVIVYCVEEKTVSASTFLNKNNK